MRDTYHIAAKPLRLLFAGLALALAGCSGDANLLRDAAIASGVTGEPKPAPDFITRSRATTVDYIPVGTQPAARSLRPKAASEVQAAEAEMDATRARNEMRGATARRAAGQ